MDEQTERDMPLPVRMKISKIAKIRSDAEAAGMTFPAYVHKRLKVKPPKRQGRPSRPKGVETNEKRT